MYPKNRRSVWLGVVLILLGHGASGRAALSSDDRGDVTVTADGPARVFTKADGSTHAELEASGIAILGDGSQMLVAHDRTSALFVVETATGKIVSDALTCPAFPDDRDVKNRPKWEGLTRDDAGNYYVIGSHSGTPDEKKARAYLVRFRMAGAGTVRDPWHIDADSVRRWHVEDSLVGLLKREGLNDESVDKRKVEGLAVRTVRGTDGKPRRQIVIGLREPDDRVRVSFADITSDPPAESALRLERLFAFDAGSRDGVPLALSSLEHIDLLGVPGFVVLTTTEDEANGFHGNALWFVPDAQLDEPRMLWQFEPTMKAEGFDVLPSTEAGIARFVIAYDNDPHTTKLPSRIQTIIIRK